MKRRMPDLTDLECVRLTAAFAPRPQLSPQAGEPSTRGPALGPPRPRRRRGARARSQSGGKQLHSKGVGADRLRPGAWGPLLLAAGLLLCPPRAATAVPSLAVVGSATAAAWLRSAGLECLEITGEQLGASIPAVPLIVLPLDQLRSDTALRSLTMFSARGGKVVAVYWGTIARPEQQPAYPVYAAASLLGFRVAGWTLTGPAVVQPEIPVAGSPMAPWIEDGATGDRGTLTTELRLGQAMVIQVEPVPTAQVLAQLVPVSGGAPLVLALRNGDVFYVAANLFERDPSSAELRRLFFWILDQAAPGLVFSQARERAGAAVAGVIRARERLGALPSPAAAAVRRLLDQADAAAARAKTLAAGHRFRESIAAADHARALTEQANSMMEGH